MQPRRLLLAASLVLFAGCKSDSTGPGLSGTMSFTFSGGISGTFSASGTLPATIPEQVASPWAAGELNPTDGGVYVEGLLPKTATTHDLALLFIHRTTVGTDNISASCSSNCSMLGFLFGQPRNFAGPPIQACDIITGTITITEISSTRVKGTFSGTGTCIDAPVVGNTTSFVVSGGTFDVAFVSAVP